MKTYSVTGHYYGKVELTIRANSLSEALKKLEKCDEDDIEVLEPSKVEYNEADVKERK